MPVEVEVQHIATCYAMLCLFSKDETPVKLAVAILPLSSRCCTPAEAQFCHTKSHPPAECHIPHPSRTWSEKVAPGSWSMSSIQVLAELVHLLQCLAAAKSGAHHQCQKCPELITLLRLRSCTKKKQKDTVASEQVLVVWIHDCNDCNDSTVSTV